MSDITDRARDGKYWCSEGCGFVDSGHRCEQWCNLTFIPSAALQRERDEEERAEPSPGYFEMYANEKARAEKAEGEAKALREALERISERRARAILPWTHEAAADEFAKMLDADRMDASAALQSQGE
jgi:hypothetical protein